MMTFLNEETPLIDDRAEMWSDLRNLFDLIERKTGTEALRITKVMMEHACEDDPIRVPTAEHPFYSKSENSDYIPAPLPEGVPDGLEEALRMITEDPAACRLIHHTFSQLFDLVISPFKGGVMLRSLLSVPGGGNRWHDE